MLLGNDLARQKMVAEPIVTCNLEVDTDSTEDTDLYPACVVTRAMERKSKITQILNHSQNQL